MERAHSSQRKRLHARLLGARARGSVVAAAGAAPGRRVPLLYITRPACLAPYRGASRGRRQPTSRQIGRALDLGAYGVIVPLVNSAAEAEAAVRAAKYHPRGGRSWGPIRGSLYGGPDYFEHADRETMLFAMIETAEAVRSAREILSVDGIDGCLVGPNDLSITHGVGPEGGETLAPEVKESIEAVVAACRATGKIAGMQLYSAASANRRIEQGFRLVSLGTDLRSMRAALSGLLGAVER
jgi:4-hydroxy-2-oxoheptanedioate aldolase